MSVKKYITIDDLNTDIPIGSKLTPAEFIYKNDKKGKKTRYVRCVCDRGVTHELLVKHVLNNKTCSCYRREVLSRNAAKYFPVVPKLLSCYNAMISRCYNPKSTLYHKYGEKGVVVCNEWKNNYQNFLDWAFVSGYKDGLCLDKDIKGDGKLYSPETCCWVTNLENQSYKSNSVKYSYNGELLTLGQIGRIVNIPREVLYRRMGFQNTSLEEAIFLIKNNINRRYAK